MEFRVAIAFLLINYLRPQDWVPGLVGVGIIQPFMAVWLLVLVAARSAESPMKGVIRTPHDWIMLAYLVYVTLTAPDAMEAFNGFLPGIAIYFFTVQSINSWSRLLDYLKWWNIALLAITALAILSLYGFDPTDAQTITQQMSGRLSLGTWMHRNPNALGHSVVTIIPLSFALYFWRGGGSGKLIMFPIFAGLAFFCLWQTQSKGAYVVGGMTFVLMVMIGKNSWLKVIIIALAVTAGFSALNFMPRMNEMADLRSDEGVMGRLLAWEIARTASKNEPTGQGWKRFQAIIEWEEGRKKLFIPKSTHSSYVQIAADLGRYGLFIYLTGLWCALRSLYEVKPMNDIEKRCQLALFLLLAATVVSNWMINREYHIEYFLLIAACAAMHRLKKAAESSQSSLLKRVLVDDSVTDALASASRDANGTPSSENYTAKAVVVNLAHAGSESPKSGAKLKPMWNRFGFIDLTTGIALTWLTFLTWDYLMKNI